MGRGARAPPNPAAEEAGEEDAIADAEADLESLSDPVVADELCQDDDDGSDAGPNFAEEQLIPDSVQELLGKCVCGGAFCSLFGLPGELLA